MLFLTLHNETDRQKSFKRIASLREQITFIDARIKNPVAKNILEEIKSKTNKLQSTIESLYTAYDNEMNTTGRFALENHEDYRSTDTDTGC